MVLKNIGIHKDLEIDFGEFTEIRGKNATGKTTVEKAIMELLDGRQKGILNNKEVDGAIKGEFSGDMAILVPFRKNETLPVKMTYKGVEITSPKKKLREINPTNIRAIDFFNGEGASLNKMQTEILLSLLDIKLEEADIIDIAGEIANPEDFEKLHPLDYINSLIAEGTGFYYKQRHDNNEKIRTFEQTDNTLHTEIAKVLHENAESFDTFKPESYKNVSLSDEIKKVRNIDAGNKVYQQHLAFIEGWDRFFKEKSDAAKEYVDKVKEKCEEEFKSDISLLTLAIEKNNKEIERLRKQNEVSQAEIDAKKSSHDDYTNKLVEQAQITADEAMEKYQKQKDDADKYIKENELVETAEFETEIKRIENIKSILPSFVAYTKNKIEYESMVESSDFLTEIITELRKLPKKVLKRSNIPVEGLSIDEEGNFTMLNSYGEEVAIYQLSDTEKLKLSIDVSIARLGEIKILIIPDWHDADRENKIIIKKRLKELGVQGIAIAKDDNLDKIQVISGGYDV